MLDTHCEKDLIINGRELKHQGIFKADEVFRVINKALQERGYHKREKKSEELVTEIGRATTIELRPYKEKSNYVTLMIKIKVIFDNVTESVEKWGDFKGRFSKGDVQLIFDAWTLSDYEDRWGMRPFTFFFKGLINKYFYIFPMEAGFKNELKADTGYIHRRIKELLDSYRAEKVKMPPEKEVVWAVEKEVQESYKRDGEEKK